MVSHEHPRFEDISFHNDHGQLGREIEGEYEPFDDPTWGIHMPAEAHPETRNLLLEYMQSEEYRRREKAVQGFINRGW